MAVCGLLVLAACGRTGGGPEPEPAVPTVPATFRPGAPGVGDPYFPLAGNGGYDVRRYLLDLVYDPASDRLTGRAAISARATADLSQFDLDLEGMEVRSVEVDGVAATWERRDQELVVAPRDGLRRGTDFAVDVRYAGMPETIEQPFGTTGFVATDDGAYVIGEPLAAKTWFPVNDHPSDHASFRFEVTVPADLEVVANGRLVSRSREGASRTWIWEAQPMASYLATVAIGEFELRSYEEAGIAYVDALDVDVADGPTPVDEVLERQPDVLAFFAERFGPYPFDSAGAIVDDADFSFALETQTRPIYSEGGFLTSDSPVLVHELAHQWFGDSVRLASWDHIWLNEGFATYAEWLWREAEGGRTAQERFDAAYGRAESDGFWDLHIGDPGADRMFVPPLYERGAMTLFALRTTVGEEAFARILRRWPATQAGRAVTTDDFVALAEEVSGEQLDDLFDAWLFTAEKPDRP